MMDTSEALHDREERSQVHQKIIDTAREERLRRRRERDVGGNANVPRQQNKRRQGLLKDQHSTKYELLLKLRHLFKG